MECRQRVCAQRQRFRLAQRRRQRVPARMRERKRGGDEAAEALLLELLAGGVDGREIGRLGRISEVVRVDLEAVAVPLPPQTHVRAGDELLLRARAG